MKSGTSFFAGIYGVGKSTLCKLLSEYFNIPYFSASDLISQINGEKYGANKTVRNVTNNQMILTEQVEGLLIKYRSIFLAGHFCILNKNGNVDKVPESVFENLSINGIILLDANPKTIISNLDHRDNVSYSYQQIMSLAECERNQAQKISSLLKIPLLIHKMQYDGNDTLKVIRQIEDGGVEIL